MANEYWWVLRQDDNGNVFVVAECPSEAAARTEARSFEARAHKQIYWIEPRGDALARSSPTIILRSMQVMRIATFNTKPKIDDTRYAEFNAWMATQPGIRALYHVREPDTERYLSISIWDSREALMAMRDRVPPGGPIGIKPDAMTIYDVEQSGGPAV